ncbi:hypothetical protein SCHPADRAFT_1616 [Schizopora paradoxa]|uniref:F-box domain-containing protein n=1 Tax=Schizopora paradoxa TaxID=27342 RepID=A0A0H2ST77_9AGAM|nr:hypothetical protein SCHPADRAFT_1616 [Schizopora paradoxa]
MSFRRETWQARMYELSVKSLYRFLSKETEYNKFSRDRCTEGIDLVFSSIKGLVNLKALVFDVDFRIMRPSHLFLDFCAILPELHNLQYLQVIVWRNNFGDNDQTAPILLDRSPPPSLKKLALHLVSPYTPVQCLKWLLRPSGGYHPEELTFDRPDWHHDYEMELSNQLLSSESFESAQRVRFLLDAASQDSARPNKAFITPIVNLLSSVRDLELYRKRSERSGELPRLTTRSPIESLTVCIGRYELYAAHLVDVEFSLWIERQALPSLRQFRVRGVRPEIPEEPCEAGFPLIARACIDASIPFVIDFEGERIEDLHGPIYVPEI